MKWWTSVAVRVATLGVVMATGAGSYVVESGDTLSGIAAELGVEVADLVRLNALENPNLIVPGQVLLTGSHDTAPALPAAPVVAGTHVVQPGESLAKIAADHGVDADELARANGIVGGRLIAGVRLQLTEPDVKFVPVAAAVHRVRSGESLRVIAGSHGTTLARLLEYNHVHDPDRIDPGTVVVIRPGWTCPVPGATFTNDWGLVKPSGKTHEGVDMFAPRGTEIVAPVSGHVHHAVGDIGGLQFTLVGDDGFRYFGSHMDTFGASGNVRAGDTLGTTGTSGNAGGTGAHLHFEVHSQRSDSPLNPYPTLLAACG